MPLISCKSTARPKFNGCSVLVFMTLLRSGPKAGKGVHFRVLGLQAPPSSSAKILISGYGHIYLRREIFFNCKRGCLSDKRSETSQKQCLLSIMGHPENQMFRHLMQPKITVNRNPRLSMKKKPREFVYNVLFFGGNLFNLFEEISKIF